MPTSPVPAKTAAGEIIVPVNPMPAMTVSTPKAPVGPMAPAMAAKATVATVNPMHMPTSAYGTKAPMPPTMSANAPVVAVSPMSGTAASNTTPPPTNSLATTTFDGETISPVTPMPAKKPAPEKVVPVKSSSTKAPASETPAPTPVSTTQTPPTSTHETPKKSLSAFFHRSQPADVRPTTPARTGLFASAPRADDSRADPLKDPVAYSKTTAELAAAPPPQADVQKIAAPQVVVSSTAAPRAILMPAAPMVGKGKIPLGAGSVLAAGDVQFVPVPMMTMPEPGYAQTAQAPQAPQLNRQYAANAFDRNAMPPAPPPMMGELAANAFGAAVPVEMMAEGDYVPPGYVGTAYGQLLPAMPSGPAVQPGFYGPPRGQVAPAGYYVMPPSPAMQRPMIMPPNPFNGAVDVQAVLDQLRDSMLPSQREWAADKLAELDWKKVPQVVDALVQAAKIDPATSVRASCIHCLARMSAATPPVIALLQSAKFDSDPRVQHEATEALARLAPGQMPTPPIDPAVQPAGVLVPAPHGSN